MSIFTKSLEGAAFNPNYDNYMVVSIQNYLNTEFNDLDKLIKTINSCHDELILVECCQKGNDIFTFMEDIGKLVIFQSNKKGNTYYLTIQKNLLF